MRVVVFKEWAQRETRVTKKVVGTFLFFLPVVTIATSIYLGPQGFYAKMQIMAPAILASSFLLLWISARRVKAVTLLGLGFLSATREGDTSTPRDAVDAFILSVKLIASFLASEIIVSLLITTLPIHHNPLAAVVTYIGAEVLFLVYLWEGDWETDSWRRFVGAVGWIAIGVSLFFIIVPNLFTGAFFQTMSQTIGDEAGQKEVGEKSARFIIDMFTGKGGIFTFLVIIFILWAGSQIMLAKTGGQKATRLLGFILLFIAIMNFANRNGGSTISVGLPPYPSALLIPNMREHPECAYVHMDSDPVAYPDGNKIVNDFLAKGCTKVFFTVGRSIGSIHFNGTPCANGNWPYMESFRVDDYIRQPAQIFVELPRRKQNGEAQYTSYDMNIAPDQIGDPRREFWVAAYQQGIPGGIAMSCGN